MAMKPGSNHYTRSKNNTISKINKHLQIMKNRVLFKSNINQISAYDNPVLTQVINSILKVKNKSYAISDQHIFKSIENYRKELTLNTKTISYEIFNSNAKSQVHEIYRLAASSPIWGELLYFLVRDNQSKKILEIGTNVGISGTYILHAMKQNFEHFKFITMEGLVQLCDLSNEKFKSITSEHNFDVISGLYEDTFPVIIENERDFDLLFIDGNHQKEPTIMYFNELKKSMSSKAIFVFDDINYSEEMKEAWNYIKTDEKVNFSIDLYKWGILIIDESEKIKNKAFGIHLSYH